MDKKTKRRVETLRGRMQVLQKQLAGAKNQPDDPAEVTRLQEELKTAQEQIIKLVEK